MSHVIVETKERIARIELNRAEKKNALTAEMYRMLGDAFAAAEADREVRVVLVHGKPDCFCAGNDIGDFLNPPPGPTPASRVFETLPAVTKPVVAAVGGAAVGIGATMLLHCDLVYAAPNARLQFPFVPLGIVPEFGSTLLLPRLAGYQRAAELLLLGRPFDAARAKEIGLVNEVVPAERLIEHAREAARALAALPPASLGLAKRLLKSGYAGVGERIAEETRLVRERLDSPEAKEAFKAFLEKRKPDFSKFS
jgi:enoyl-CoA hydratase/carnithine racemase